MNEKQAISLYKNRDASEKQELLKVIEASPRSYDDIIKFLAGPENRIQTRNEISCSFED
ncbi:MAG: hypothetical protein PUF78_05390 [Lachnospiraceae bacterium]|nr:hypothetical protein [Lachnospiraceae bacterium]